jgi:hypothetical protein
MVGRARNARDHNGGKPEPAWSTGERLIVALILGDQTTLDLEDCTEDQALSRLGGDLYFHGYPSDASTWVEAARRLLGRPEMNT